MVAYSFKKRFIAPIKAGLGLKVEPEDRDDQAATMLTVKRQTIRAIGKRRHARPGDLLQLYTAMRTKQCRKIGDAICIEVLPVIIWIPRNGGPLAVKRAGLILNSGELKLFAQQDGFASLNDMTAFWRTEHKGVERFEGFMILWRPPIVYTPKPVSARIRNLLKS